MSHPTARPPPEPGARPLTDEETPDFLERHRVAVLAFLDPATEASRKVEERVGRLALEMTDRAAFGTLDVRAHPLVARAVGVKSVPEVLVFVDGATVDRLMGVVPERILREAVVARVGRGPPPTS